MNDGFRHSPNSDMDDRKDDFSPVTMELSQKLTTKVAPNLVRSAELLLLAGLGIYLFRVPLVGSLLIGQLTRLGVPMNSTTVKEVSLNQIELRNLSLGAANELRADIIYATWALQKAA